MAMVRSVFAKFSIARELLVFFWERRLWWMIPVVVMLLFLGMLIIFAQSSGIAPFIYTLF